MSSRSSRFANGETLKWVEIDAAGRAYDYNTFGSGTTGKVSGLVRTLGGVAVRGSYGTAFRAPSISELFSGQVDSFPLNLEDPCDTRPPSKKVQTPLPPMVAAQCLATGVPANSTFGTSQQRVKLGGNPALRPEKGTVGTAGVVYEPARGLDVSLDYWRIDLDDAIINLPIQTILSQCYQVGNNSFCNQIQRDPVTHEISHILDLNPERRWRDHVGPRLLDGVSATGPASVRCATRSTPRTCSSTTSTPAPGIPSTMKEQILQGRGFYDLGVFPDLKFNLFTTWDPSVGIRRRLQRPVHRLVPRVRRQRLQRPDGRAARGLEATPRATCSSPIACRPAWARRASRRA